MVVDSSFETFTMRPFSTKTTAFSRIEPSPTKTVALTNAKLSTEIPPLICSANFFDMIADPR
jgi:hypothetical protein